MTNDQSDLHNRLAAEIAQTIVKAVYQAGGEGPGVMVMLESVVSATLVTIVKPGGDDDVVTHFAQQVRERLAHLRLLQGQPMGTS